MTPVSRGFRRSTRTFGLILATLKCRRLASASIATIGLRIRLRQYQEECIQAVLHHLRNGHKRLGISLATGAGKTVIFTQLIDRVKPSAEEANLTLILAHRQELVEQAARHCVHAYPTKRVEIEMGSKQATGLADITIASVQSITSGNRILKFDPRRFKLVLVDEAHHIVAPGYMRTLDHFGLLKPQSDTPALIGVSATLSRFDGLRLGSAIDHIVYHKDYIDMIGEKWLSQVVFTTVRSAADISKVKKGAHGDFQPGELSKAVNTDITNEVTVRSWLAKARHRRSTLVFCVDLAHVAGLTAHFREHGVDARFVTGNTPKAERANRLEAFKQGRFQVLLNCGVFIEGTDIPNVDCVVLARPTKSRNLVVQMIGRGMRLHPKKKDCHIIDMVASLETGIVTTPTLFGLDPSEIVNEAKVEDMMCLRDRRQAEEFREQVAEDYERRSSALAQRSSQSLTFTDYNSVFDLIEDTVGEQHIRAISPYSWVCIAEDRFILNNSSGAYLKLERNVKSYDEEWIVTETHILSNPDSKAPYLKSRRLATTSTFLDSVHAADTYAKKKYPFHMISKHQAWRSRPATESQIAFLNRLRLKNDHLTPDSVTKGKAGDMITKIKHGARGRYADLEATKRRQSKVKLKMDLEQSLRERETVSVGLVV